MLMFLYNLGMTIWKAKRLTTTEGVLMAGLAMTAILYLPSLLRVRQLHGRHLLPVVDGAPVGRRRLGDDPGSAARLPADSAVGHRSRSHGEVAVRHRRADVHLRPARHGAPLLLRRRAVVLAAASAGSSPRSSRWCSSPCPPMPTRRCAVRVSRTRTRWRCTGRSAARSSPRWAPVCSGSRTRGRRSTSGRTAP